MERDSPPSPDTSAAVVVSYHPDEGLADRVARLAAQTARVLVVDNTSPLGFRRWLQALAAPTVEIILNEQNLGVAAALNQGMRRAVEHGYHWGLTMDQDSTVDPDLLGTLGEIYRACPEPSRVGLISANARSKHSGRVAVRCPDGAGLFVECKTVITSGSLIALAAYQRAGPFREDFFIEGVDLEYCLRLRRHGYRILCSCRPLMTHAAGRMDEARVLGRTILVPHHDPWRYYYMLRNFVLIVREYWRQEPRWVGAATVGVGKMMVRVMLFERQRPAKFAAMLRGVRDGIAGPPQKSVRFVT